MYRFQVLIDNLSLEEKAKLVTGADVWHTKEISRLKIPSIMMSDGPHGLRKQVDSSDNLGINSSEPATIFPPAVLCACSFDPNLIRQMGIRIGEEARAQGVQLVLGPGTNIKRSPLCGRNFEYFSEDPRLAGALAGAWISGVQSKEVGACLKHFVCNNQETNRFLENSVVDERTLHEIYLKPFEIAIKSNPVALMSSYNRVNNSYVNESSYFLKDIVRKNWNYEGCLITDWGATNNRIEALKAGQDLEMPSSGIYHVHQIVKAIKEKVLSKEALDLAVSHILDMVMTLRPVDYKPCDYDEHHQFARKVVSESLVLLKNKNNVLPLKEDERILFVGELFQKPRMQGGGSSHIIPTQTESLNKHYQEYSENAEAHEGYHYQLKTKDKRINKRLRSNVVNQAPSFDKVVVFIGLPEEEETEGLDRKTLNLPKEQIRLIKALSEVHENIVLVVMSGSAVIIPEFDQIKGVIYAGLLGQAGSLALLDVLFGKVNPSGRLAETFPKSLGSVPSTKEFPGGNLSSWYKEGIFVGYRYFETFKEAVQYPFGYGLSYTTFVYQNLKINKNSFNDKGSIKVSFSIRNIGERTGKEVVQLYLHHKNPAIVRPEKELIAFDKIELKAGDSKDLTFEISNEELSYYHPQLHEFVSESGDYEIMVGRNVRDIVLSASFSYGKEPSSLPKQTESPYLGTDEAFLKVLDFSPWPRTKKNKRPFTMNSSFRALRKSLIGKVMFLMLKREAKKLAKENNQSWQRRVIINTLLDTPIRTLSIMSSGKLTMKQAEGIVEMANRKFASGWEKYKEV